MNLTSGKFRAPRPGTYFFSFAAVARFKSSSGPAWFYSHLYLNGKIIGSSHVAEWNRPVYQYSPLTLQWTLNLKKDDRVWVQIEHSGGIFSQLFEGSSFDNNNPYTHFTGFMLEEEIVASL